MKWFSIDMPLESVTDGAYHQLCRSFQRAFIDAGAPADLALFAWRRTDTSRRVFLSPSSAEYMPELIHEYGGRPCRVPDSESVTLVYGVPGARSLLTDLAGDGPAQSHKPNTAIYPLAPTRSTASVG